MTSTPYFSSRLFSFLRELKKNNNRRWFEANKERYIADVRDPMLRFIEDFGKPLFELSPHFLADPRATGGSMFRIYRDIRFSTDKSPYKTHAAAQFRHVRGKDVHAPGFYLHLEPGSVFVASGIWRPDAKTANAVREAIATKSERWKSAVSGREFRKRCQLEGESLVRPPRGFDPDHPLIEDLKRTDFIVTAGFTQREACSPQFMKQCAAVCAAMGPFMKFLTESLGLRW
jgi:uncharacterized protein (TIGR02453 family)